MTYLAMLAKMIRDRKYGNAAVSAAPAVLMITGVAELISERIEGLDRELPKVRLYRGFGALTIGGITGIAASAITKSGKRTKYAMGGGAVLCAVFAGLLLRGYKIAVISEIDGLYSFTKFVIDRDGNVAARFEPTADMDKVEDCVKSLL